MAQDDPEQRIADLERQLAEAKAAAHSQENRTGTDPSAAPAPFPAPPQASAWNPQVFGTGQPVMAGPPFSPPFAQPPGQAAFWPPGVGYNSVGLRVVRFLLHGLWWAGIGCVGFGIYVGIKIHRVFQDGQNAKCGNAFDAIFKHDGYYQFGGGDTLRSACLEQIAKAQTMTSGLIGLGALLIFASFVVLVISWTMKWRRGWRPWRPYGHYGSRRYARSRSLGGDVVGGIIDNLDWR